MVSRTIAKFPFNLVAITSLVSALEGGKTSALDSSTTVVLKGETGTERTLARRQDKMKRMKVRQYRKKKTSAAAETPLTSASVGIEDSLQQEGYHHIPTTHHPPTTAHYYSKKSSKKGGKGGKGGKSSKKGGGGGKEREGFSTEQTCALFDHFFDFQICPKSNFYCPYVGWEKDVHNGGTAHRRRMSYYPEPEPSGTKVECLSETSFVAWCEQYMCETEQVDQCLNIIKGCCSGWCDSGLTLKERCDAFEIVAQSSSAGNPDFIEFYCAVYENVICPDKNLKNYICDNAADGSWEDFCNTYSDNIFKYHGQDNAETVEQIFQHCMTQDVFNCCCGPVPAPNF